MDEEETNCCLLSKPEYKIDNMKKLIENFMFLSEPYFDRLKVEWTFPSFLCSCKEDGVELENLLEVVQEIRAYFRGNDEQRFFSFVFYSYRSFSCEDQNVFLAFTLYQETVFSGF